MAELVAEQRHRARIHRGAEQSLSGAGAVDEKPEQADRRPAERGDHDFVRRRAHAENVHHARDQRANGHRIVGEEVGHPDLDHDAPEQGAGEDENLLLRRGMARERWIGRTTMR